MTGRVDSEAIELSDSISGSAIGIGSGAGKGIGLVEQSVVVTSLTSNTVY